MLSTSVVLVITISGHSTSTASPSLSEPSFDVVTDAVLSIVPQEANAVGDVMCTDLLWLRARSPQLQVSVPLAIEQPESLFAPSIVQLRPASSGSVSITVTPCAVPEPVLVASMTKPMSSPALTESASAVLVMTIVGQSTVI